MDNTENDRSISDVVSYANIDIDRNITLPKDYLSPSAIDMYLKCPKKFEYHYVNNLSSPKTMSLVKGSAVHKGIETYYNLRLDNVNDIKSKDIADFAVEKLDEISVENEIKMEITEKEQAIKEVHTATSNYIDDIGVNVEPVTVEAELRCIIKGVPILGFTDLIRKMTPEEIETQNMLVEDGIISEGDRNVTTVVCDNKTSNKKWMQSTLENSLQLNIYSIGTGISQQEIHNVVLNNAGCPTYKIKAICTKNKGYHVANLIRDVAESITKGSFPRCGLGNWWCSEKFCDFYDICRSGKV